MPCCYVVKCRTEFICFCLTVLFTFQLKKSLFCSHYGAEEENLAQVKYEYCKKGKKEKDTTEIQEEHICTRPQGSDAGDAGFG